MQHRGMQKRGDVYFIFSRPVWTGRVVLAGFSQDELEASSLKVKLEGTRKKSETMEVVFCQAVETYQNSLKKFLLDEKKHKRERKLCTWSYVSKKLVGLLRKFPLGLTESVILSELLTALSLPQNFKVDCIANSPSNDKKKLTFISELRETNEVDLSCYVECYVQLISRDNSSGTTRIVRLGDRIFGNNAFEEEIPTMEMYLDQKSSRMEPYIFIYPLRMTNLLIHRFENPARYRLLPTEHVMPMLDSDTDKAFICEKFGTLEGISEEDAFPHYVRSVFVTITEISDLKTVDYPFGDSATNVVVGLVDVNGRTIDFILWDEAVAFKNLMSVGDSLGIEDPFLVKDEGSAHLEYGPATIFFSIPAVFASQHTQANSIKKTPDGKLDFEMYPHRVISSDVIKNCINISFVGVVKSVSQKESFQYNERKGIKFILEVFDDYGVLQIQVYDSCKTLHESIYVGQMVLLENMETDDYSCCILKTWQLGKLSILSALKGYVASPCLYTVTSGMHIAENGNYFIIGKIAGFQPTIGEFTRKIHLTCLRTVEQNREGKLFCPYCNSKNLMEIQSEEHIAAKDLSTFWELRYHFDVSVELEDYSCIMEFEATEQVFEELMELSAEEFTKIDDNVRKLVLLRPTDKTYVFAVTRYGHMKRIDAFEIASESFLENFKKPAKQ